MKNKKRLVILIALCIAVGAAAAAFFCLAGDSIAPGKTDAPPASKDLRAETVAAAVETVTRFYDAVGTVEPRSKARVSSRIPAQVAAVEVDAGDRVEKGKILVSLDDRQMQARLAQARQSENTALARKEEARQRVDAANAAFTEAKSAYKRVKNFYAEKAATEEDLEQARSRFLQSKAALNRSKESFTAASAGADMAKDAIREAEIALSYTKIEAPASGKVLKRLVDPGDMAMPGKPLLLLRTSGGLRLEAHVRESLIDKVEPGAVLSADLQTLDRTVRAKVEELIPYADPQTRSFLVKARLPEIPGLYPGMYGKLLIPYMQSDVVLIPERAVYRVGQLELVLTKTPEGFKRRYIKTGNTYGDKLEVLAGLKGSETVKLRGPEND
ncbi:MAG: efflux RND transporter periplasmic adaptor subunit [Desulfosalsimonadaceae bacterium]